MGWPSLFQGIFPTQGSNENFPEVANTLFSFESHFKTMDSSSNRLPINNLKGHHRGRRGWTMTRCCLVSFGLGQVCWIVGRGFCSTNESFASPAGERARNSKVPVFRWAFFSSLGSIHILEGSSCNSLSFSYTTAMKKDKINQGLLFN